MYTVIILSKHSAELLNDYRFLFKPFVDSGKVGFCYWNDLGADVTEALPDLYHMIKGKLPWRAIIVDTEPAFMHPDHMVSDYKNPFDFIEKPSLEFPSDSPIPLVRLTHMICGYPSAPVKNFEEGYEYVEEITGETVRVRASELTEDEICALSERYGDRISRVYMEEKTPPEVEKARKALEEKYSFNDERPTEVYLVSTRRHMDDSDTIYTSWMSPYEIESSDFSRKNDYPGMCRFLCCSITNPENSKFMKEVMELWLSVLTLAVNKIPASTLQAYKLYRLGVDLSMDDLSNVLNGHLNKMQAVRDFVQELLKAKPEYTFKDSDRVVETQQIPVIIENVSMKELSIDLGKIGMARDCPQDEMLFWNREVKEKERAVDRFLKIPRRALDKASHYMKEQVELFKDEEYELDRFQLTDLKEEIDALQLQVLTGDTHAVLDEKRIKSEMKQVDQRIKREISDRIYRNVALGMGFLLLFVYLIGYVPYIFNSLMISREAFISSLLLTLGAVAAASVGGIVVLFLMRRKHVKDIKEYNSLLRQLAVNVNASAKKYQQYFSLVCTYMKAQIVYESASKIDKEYTGRIQRLRTHRQALSSSIERDEELTRSFGISRVADFEKNVTEFFDENRIPKDNSLYYYETEFGKHEIPLNISGDSVQAPYRFVAKLKIEREDLYEKKKEVE